MTLLEELSVDISNQYQIYQDLDGCLCDFDERFEHYSGMDPKEYETQAIQQYGEKMGKQKFWNLIDDQVGVRFWRGMKWMPEGKELWDYVKKYKPIILTAPSMNEVSRIGKKLWVQDNLGSNIPIEFKRSSQKHEFSKPNAILIDDRVENIQSWKSKNGIGILYKGNTNEVIRELKKIGL